MENVVGELRIELAGSQRLMEEAINLERRAQVLKSNAESQIRHIRDSKVNGIHEEIMAILGKLESLQQGVILRSGETTVELTTQLKDLYQKLESICESFGHDYRFEGSTEILDSNSSNNLNSTCLWRCSCCGGITYSDKQGMPLDLTQVNRLKQIQSVGYLAHQREFGIGELNDSGSSLDSNNSFIR